MLETVVLDEDDREEDEVYILPETFLEDRIVRSPPGAEGTILKKLAYTSIYSQRHGAVVWGYALTGVENERRIVFIGTPAPDTEIQIDFFERQVLDTSSNDNTNKLLMHYPDIYLHGVLFYQYQKTQDLELAQASSDQVVEAIKTLNDQTGRYLGGTIAKPTYNLGHMGLGSY
jgi:hypothetical protein